MGGSSGSVSNNQIAPQPKLIPEQSAAQKAGLTYDPLSQKYFNGTGDAFSASVAPTPAPAPAYNPYQSYNPMFGYNNNPLGIGTPAGGAAYNPFGNNMLGMNNYMAQQAPAPAPVIEGQLANSGYIFNPFTGTMQGISEGKKSMIDRMTAASNAAPNVPSLDQLFSNSRVSALPASSLLSNEGVDRFLSAPKASNMTKASATGTSSGAGRFAK